MKIYTRTGDQGQTGLFGGHRVAKYHPRVEAYGDVDELNSAVGIARAACGPAHAGLNESLGRIQAECFVIGALLATPAGKAAMMKSLDTRLLEEAPPRLESEIDAWEKDLDPLKTFVLPGGSTTGASLHLARAVCRRAERRAVELGESDSLPAGLVIYLNRLSDWLFTAARWANMKSGHTETPWVGLAASR